MSRDICFYAVSSVKEELPDIVNVSDMAADYSCTSEKLATDWEKKIGVLKTVRTHTVNTFSVCEKKFGVHPASMRLAGYPASEYEFFDERGDFIGSLTSEDFKPFYYDQDTPSYVYCKKQIASSENAYLFDAAKSQIVSEDYLMEMLKKAVSYLDEEIEGGVPSYYGEAVVAALKALFAVKDGSMVYMDVD